MYFVALAVSAYITLVCLFYIPRPHVSFRIHQVAQAAAAVPTITASGGPVTDMGTTGSFGSLWNAKLDSSQSVVLMADTSNGLLLASAAPYAYDKRTTGTANRATMCSFDGNEVSSPSTSNIYCRRAGRGSDTFLVFKYSDLSAVRDSGNNDPLYVAASTVLNEYGMVTVVGIFMFVTSNNADSTLYRIDISTLTYTGTVTTTKSAQDTSAATETYRYGVCDSASFCYACSNNKRLAKFTQNNAGSPTYVSTLDLSVSVQLDTGGLNGPNNNVVLDSAGNNLLVATTEVAFNIAKIDLGTFAYVSKVTLTGATYIILCENCLTAGVGGETYMMVISYVSAKDARFIKISDMTEVTDAGTFLNTGNAFTGWLTTTLGSAHGGIVTSNAAVQTLITTGVAPTATTTITGSTTTTGTSTSTTSTTITPTKTTTATTTTTTTQSLPPTRTVTPTLTRTALLSSSASTSITSIPSTSWSPSVLSASQSDTFPTKTFNITPSSSITHETISLSNSESDVLISRLLRDSISQAVQNLGIAVTGIKGGASATNARKIQAVVAMADCAKEDISDDEIPEVEPDSNPLALRIGSQRFDTYRGSIVGACLFIFLWGIMMFTFAYIRTKIEYGCSLKRALRKVGMPGTLSAPGFSLLPVAVNSASAMMMRYKSPGYEEDSTMDLSIIAFGFVIGVFFPLVVLAWTIREVKRHEKLLIPTEDDAQDDAAEDTSNNKKKKKSRVEIAKELMAKDKKEKSKKQKDKKKGDADHEQDDLKDPTWKVWFDWLTEPRYEYKKTKFSQCFGPLFDFVTVPVFVFLSFVITIAMEIAEGSSSLCSKGDRTCCSGGLISMIALCSLDTLLILFYKIPFLVRIDYVVISICSVINVVMVALIYEMFQDSTSNERSLASGSMIKRVGDKDFDVSDEKKSSGSVVVDHTESLVILSQLAFYLALASGLLGLLNELIGAAFEVRAAYWSGKKKKLADLMDFDDLEEELMLVADDKKKKTSSPLSPANKKLLVAPVDDAHNHQSVGGKQNSTPPPPLPPPKSTPEQDFSGEARKNLLPSSSSPADITPTTREQQSSPTRKRKRRLVSMPHQRGEIADNSVGATADNNNNSAPRRTTTASREKPLPVSPPPPVRLSADALAQLNRGKSRRK